MLCVFPNVRVMVFINRSSVGSLFCIDALFSSSLVLMRLKRKKPLIRPMHSKVNQINEKRECFLEICINL